VHYKASNLYTSSKVPEVKEARLLKCMSYSLAVEAAEDKTEFSGTFSRVSTVLSVCFI
jgi:hypothetical protein